MEEKGQHAQRRTSCGELFSNVFCTLCSWRGIHPWKMDSLPGTLKLDTKPCQDRGSYNYTSPGISIGHTTKSAEVLLNMLSTLQIKTILQPTSGKACTLFEFSVTDGLFAMKYPHALSHCNCLNKNAEAVYICCLKKKLEKTYEGYTLWSQNEFSL